ncbi:MAG: tRNA (N(6)-L-threonylcarbamoyladenosine(37)-C(2))-methylthiotransferase MtaB [Ureaplasma sp.]|nr:tRNA (N(6)-L-threonylcarbamoyladenosine(37)-C(2))-methylthiotransferase MtaB [Ureaplasma sp.]MDE7222018.1 tRNA (N(6)-L-threonylcarbamoyladenosine(37)-C(2))-methylthiotransferase MtaB [Ureaplasma sp.]
MNKLNLSTFYAITLGCKVNTYETNIIANDLIAEGLIRIDDFSKCDVAIINTCSVTNTADSKSRNAISKIRHANPNAIIIVCGCYSQVASESLKSKYRINILIGNKYKNNVVQLINEFLENKQQIVRVDNLLLENKFEETSVDIYTNQTRAFVKIQDGCNFMCSYCIIPFTRGRQRSKKMSTIIDEIKKLVANNYKEIVLTGVNTAGYKDDKNDFYQLLKNINNLNGNFRVRISSVEPFQISDEIIELICKNKERFAQHWHICLQSGSDNVLEKMNRKYKTVEFENLINKIYKLSSDTAITTDIIAAFPTETNLDHQLTIDFINKIGFSKLHVFPYSKRNYTPAAKLSAINSNIVSNRMKDLLELSNKLTNSFNKKFINKIVDVLFETYDNGINSGYSSQYIRVDVNSANDYSNQLKKVKITKVVINHVIGEIVE